MKSLLAAFALSLALAPTAAHAVLLELTGVNDTSITATVDFQYDASTATVGLSVSNTSILHDPVLTSLAFNAPDLVTGISSFLASGDLNAASWEAQFNQDGINTPGAFGLFDVGALSGPTFSGGSPNDGIGVGGTGVFEISLLGTNLDTLTEDSFLSLFSAPDGGNTTATNFITRFQSTGALGEGSDVAIPGDPPQVNEPATLGLLGLALAGLGVLRRRQRA